MQKIAFFSTHSYDKEYFNRYNEGHELSFFEAPLDENTVNLTNGAEVVCAFVNDKLNRKVLEGLSKNGVKMIAMRCAGYNNVDLGAAKELGLKIA
ncbi:MAG: 2-hydroxyacid dehydrogenase, partial [Flavitalea sp.]